MPSSPSSPPDDKASSGFYKQLNASVRSLGRHKSRRKEKSEKPPNKHSFQSLFSAENVREKLEAYRRPRAASPAASGRASPTESFFRCQQRSPLTLEPSGSPHPAVSLSPDVFARMVFSERPSFTHTPRAAPSPAPSSDVNGGRPRIGSGVTMGHVPKAWQQQSPRSMDVVRGPPGPTSPHSTLSVYSGPSAPSEPSVSSGPVAGISDAWPPERGTVNRLRAYAQRGILDELGLSAAESGIAASPGQRQASEVLLSATWRALLELALHNGGRPQNRRELHRAAEKAKAEVARIAHTYGANDREADALAGRAAALWGTMVARGDSAPPGSAAGTSDALTGAHSLMPTVIALKRVYLSDPMLGRLRLAYLVGTALQLGDYRRSLEDVPESALACDDDDFEALLLGVWRSHKTASLLQVYQTQRRALHAERPGGR